MASENGKQKRLRPTTTSTSTTRTPSATTASANTSGWIRAKKDEEQCRMQLAPNPRCSDGRANVLLETQLFAVRHSDCIRYPGLTCNQTLMPICWDFGSQSACETGSATAFMWRNARKYLDICGVCCKFGLFPETTHGKRRRTSDKLLLQSKLDRGVEAHVMHAQKCKAKSLNSTHINAHAVVAEASMRAEAGACAKRLPVVRASTQKLFEFRKGA